MALSKSMKKIIVEEKSLSDRITCCNERHTCNVTVVQNTIIILLPRSISADYSISI